MIGKTNTSIGGSGSDDCTATKTQVLIGYTTVTKDSNDEITFGTMPDRGAESQSINAEELYTIPEGYHNGAGKITANSLANQTTGNATAGYIYKGKTAWVNGDQITGSMAVNNILNFNASTYSTTQILLQWQNPYMENGKPFSGVHIWYSTGGYADYNGIWIYSGYGNNSTSGGWSQTIVTMPAVGIGYYFSTKSYVTCSAGDIWGNTLNAYAATTSHGIASFTLSQIWTVPAGVRFLDVCCVGGGSGGNGGFQVNSNNRPSGGGGGGGYVNNWYGIAVTPGQLISITVGAGGTAGRIAVKQSEGLGGNGGTSSFGSYIAGGGALNKRNTPNAGNNGGSGGGAAYYNLTVGYGGTDGGDGISGSNSTTNFAPGVGQGFTTRAFSGTLYAGGGGGGTGTIVGKLPLGGAGGGGRGSYKSDSHTKNAALAGSANTGGGGGGGGSYSGGSAAGGAGIVIVRW